MNEFFEKLIEKIKLKKSVIIMTHKNMDLDGFSSSLCLLRIIEKLGKKGYIYVDVQQTNDVIKKTMLRLKKNNYEYMSLYEKDLNSFNFEDTLLVVVDIYKKHLVENAKLLEMVDDVVVIDHHIQDNDYISNTSLVYVNPDMSSVAEIMIHMCRFLDFKMDGLLSTILMCAINIDTNYFNFKTTGDTFEAVAYLMRCGASNIIKQELLRESKETYLERQFYIRNSFQVKDDIILCVIDDKVVSSSYLAIVADSLLQFEKIEASFCIGLLGENVVGISARSIGNIDVQAVMKKLGGGGHKTDAATKIIDMSIEDVKNSLIELIKEG